MVCGKMFCRMLLPAAFLFLAGCGDRSHAGTVRHIRDLNAPDFRIGSMTGSVALRETREKLPQAQTLEYSMPVDAFTAIRGNKIDAVVLDRPTLEYMALSHPELTVMRENLAIGHISVAAAKKNSSLMAKVNEFIRTYRRYGTYSAMYTNWFRTVEPAMPEIPVPEKPDGVLKIGVTANNEPLCFIKDGKMAGFDIEFALRFAAYINRKAEFTDLPYDALVIGLESGRIDLAVAYMDALPEREESVLFSENYVDSPITCLIRKEKCSAPMPEKIRSPQDLNFPQRIIACESEILASRVARKHLPQARFLEFTGPPDCYLALGTGKVHAVVYDRPALEYAALARPEFTVLPENIAMGHISVAAAKDQTTLIREVDRFIRQYRKDGTLREMYDRWILTKNPVEPVIPRAEKTEGELVVGVTSNNPPMCFIRNGRFSGFDVEFAHRMGAFLKRRIKLMDLPYEGLIPALNGGRIHLAVAQMDATQERKESVVFSEEYIDSPVALMIRKKDHAESLPEAETENAGSRILEEIRASVVSLGGSFEKTFVREGRWKLILRGLLTTLVITVFAVILGTAAAFPLCFMCRSKRKVISWLGERYISLVMGTPILVILMILYYVIFAKVDISGVAVAVLAFAMDFAAYTSVTLRSGIEGVPRGQTEAALALGHTPAGAFLRFVLPQAVRTVLPVYRGEIISTLKATSIVGYIAIMDLTKMGDIIRSRTYEAFFPLIAIALIYFLTAKCLTGLLVILEKKLDPAAHRDRLQRKGWAL